MIHIKPLIVNSVLGIASMVGIIGAAGEALPIPTEMVPGPHTTIEGILVALFAMYIRSAPTKQSNEEIQKSINNAVSTLGESVKNNSDGIKGLVAVSTEQNLKLANWMGETTATIRHHGELIRELKDDMRDVA